MIDFENETDFKLSEATLELLEKIATSQSKKDLELILTGNKEIQELNTSFRGISKPTDVLSFPLEDMDFTPLGSIVISYDFVKQGAKTYNHSLDDEIALLFIHGFLHLLGYDHEKDKGEHRKEEEELIKIFNLPNSLIIRND